MICAIMQPSYLPWAGYFNLIDQADVFVFLDDAQLQKNSWHNRNRILMNHAPHWITVPVSRTSLSQTILESMIDVQQNWKQKQVKLLRQTYSKHPFFEEILEFCAIFEENNAKNLAELNIHLARWIMAKLDIKTRILLSSELDISGKRTDRVISILEKLEADVYLSPKGAAEYLDADDFLNKTSIRLCLQSFEPKPYNHHRHSEFVSHLSIIDVVANIGWGSSKTYIT